MGCSLQTRKKSVAFERMVCQREGIPGFYSCFRDFYWDILRVNESFIAGVVGGEGGGGGGETRGGA